MPRFKRVWGAWFGLIAVLGGCNGPFGGRAVLLDASEEHPLGANGQEAELHGSMSWDFVKFHDHYGWSTARGRLHPADLVREIENFEPRPIPELILGKFDGRSSEYRYKDTRTVVCIDPIVVVITPKPTIVPGSLTPQDDVSGPVVLLMVGGVRAHLNYGYFAARNIEYAESAQWFSPTLGVHSTSIDLTSDEPAIELGADGKRAARLLFTRTGDRWRISMKQSPR